MLKIKEEAETSQNRLMPSVVSTAKVIGCITHKTRENEVIVNELCLVCVTY